jgi:hypothetical protein
MDIELINRVQDVLENPKGNLNELNELSKKLCNNSVNITCSSCITDAVILLTRWLKENNTEARANYLSKAMNGEYELKQINLFVQVYDYGNPDRQSELDSCLRINKGSGYFKKVIELKDRPTYQQLFHLTKSYPDDINIIANSDIFFDETILMTKFMDADDCYALSRWDYSSGNLSVLFDRNDSQDAWVFSGSVTKVVNCDFTMGVPGCDNRIAHCIKSAGYKVLNPSKTIHAIHLHETNLRTYDHTTQRVPEPYHFIKPHY